MGRLIGLWQKYVNLITKLPSLTGYILLSVSVYLLFVGPLLGLPWLKNILINSNHPLNILSVMSTIVAWSWITVCLLPANQPDYEAKSKFCMCFTGSVLLMLFMVWAEYYISPGCTENSLLCQHIITLMKTPILGVSIFIASLWFLFSMVSSVPSTDKMVSSVSSNDKKEDNILHWGRLTTIIVMVLAVFAFALHGSGGHGESQIEGVSINWKELPAILIMFILSELGVHLVHRVQLMKEEVDKVANVVTDTNKTLGDSKTSLSKASETLEKVGETADKSVNEVSKNICFFRSDLWKDRGRIQNTLGIADDESLWKKINSFMSGWTPSSLEDSSKVHPSKLLCGLFEAFVGDDGAGKGVVRTRNGHTVTCVAVDSVFAKASKEWLTMEVKDGDNAKPLVIWALTSLLPTQFAFPSAYHKNSSTKDNPRDKALNDFVQSIIDCRGGDKIAEYKRVTVLKHEIYSNLKNTYYGLDSWYVTNDRNYEDTAEVCHELNISSAAKDGMNHTTMTEIFGNNGKSFHSNYPSNSTVFKLSGNGPNKFALIADTTIKNSKINNSKINNSKWRSIRDWYIKELHKSHNGGPSAWWVALKENYDPNFFDSLCITWDDLPIESLDLLLIGTKNDDNANTFDWYGATISNLNLEKAECMVEMVFDNARLKHIETIVKKLSNNFGQDTSYHTSSDNIVSVCDTWDKWQ